MKIKLNTKKKTTHIEQWIEIYIRDGKTVTSYHPPNDELERLRLRMNPLPDLIYRRLNFFQGVPGEYAWLQAPPQFFQYGGQFLQRVTAEEWPRIFEAEQRSRHGHVVCADSPAGRPPDHGFCNCEHCTWEREHGSTSRFDNPKPRR